MIVVNGACRRRHRTFSSSRLFQENQVVFVSASITSTIHRRHAS